MPLGHSRQMLHSSRAQAIIELAVFGGIVLYLIGLIVAQGTTAAYQQDAQLQAMRLALLSSYASSNAGSSSRNTASFMILEDRLTSGTNKYGQLERQPFIAQGGGTMTKNLFKPIDWKDVAGTGVNNDIPIMDVRINGQHFNFRLATAAVYRIRFYPAFNTMDPPQRSANSRVTISLVNACAPVKATCVPDKGLCAVAPDTGDYCTTSCETLLEDTADQNAGTGDNEDAQRLLYEWINYGWPNSAVWGSLASDGYPPAYQSQVINNLKFDRTGLLDNNVCDVDSAIYANPPGPVGEPGDITKRTVMRRYDWNRDGVMPDMCCLDPMGKVMWQWSWKTLQTVGLEVNTKDGVYPNYDIDGDLSEESVYKIVKWGPMTTGCGGLLGYDIEVIDWDRGDYNTNDEADDFANPQDAPGVKPDTTIKTYVKNGAYYQALEQPAAVVNTTQKNQTDVVERMFVLNHRMLLGGSLCSVANQTLQGGVQACCQEVDCCSTGSTPMGQFRSAVTCVEFPINGRKILYIRSNIDDLRGRKAITAW